MGRQHFRNPIVTGSLPQLIAGGATDYLFGGTGEDGAFAPGASYDFTDAEGEWVIKNYSSITINSGEVISAANRLKGLILFCNGDVTINGEIDLDGKGYGSEEPVPVVWDRYLSTEVLVSAWVKYCFAVKGGDGGGGGGSSHSAYSKYGGNGAHAGGTGSNSYANGVSASGWTPGWYHHTSVIAYGLGAGLLSPGKASQYKSGGAGWLGVQNAGGNGAQGGTGADGISATLTTSAVAMYGGALLLIIAKGTITLGSTANIHSDGSQAPGSTHIVNGCNGSGGGGNIVLMSEGSQSIDGAATQSVDGGTAAVNSSWPGNGGAGDVGTIINQVVV